MEKILEKNDSITTRIWVIEINNKKFNLMFDDFPTIMELEALTQSGNNITKKIKTKILN